MCYNLPRHANMEAWSREYEYKGFSFFPNILTTSFVLGTAHWLCHYSDVKYGDHMKSSTKNNDVCYDYVSENRSSHSDKGAHTMDII